MIVLEKRTIDPENWDRHIRANIEFMERHLTSALGGKTDAGLDRAGKV